MPTIKKIIKKGTLTKETVSKIKNGDVFKVVNGNEVVQGEFDNLEDAKAFAKSTGFKVI